MPNTLGNIFMFMSGVAASFALFSWQEQSGSWLSLADPPWWVWVIQAFALAFAEGYTRRIP